MTEIAAADEPMERACFILEIRLGMEEEYDRRHRAISKAFEDEMRGNGAANYTLFRRGRTVVGVLECRPDAKTVFENGQTTPLSVAWSRAMVDVLEQPPRGSDAPLSLLTEVWHLA
jgi:L-rhamnose mutarotase